MLPVRGDGKGDNVLAHAAVLARKFKARVRVIHCHPKTDDMMPYGVVIPQILRKQIEEATERNIDLTERQLLEEFRALSAEFGLEETDHQSGKATARFIEYEGKQIDAVRYYGRLADLICVPKPDEGNNLGKNTLKSALFSSGRPVLMCPHQDPVPEDFSDNIAIGWNGSIEATRAVAMSTPLLASAKSITILFSGTKEHAATPEDLQRYLELKGLSSTIRTFEAKSGIVGAELLDETKKSGAGMLVMGAYHDSYERETIFGGNSQVVVKKAEFPILMVH